MRSTASSSTTSCAERPARARGALAGIARYFLVGGAAACVDIGLFMLLAQSAGMPYQAAAAASFLLATLVNYVLSVRFVFVSGARFGRKSELALVYAVSAAGLAINALVLWAGVEAAGLPLLPAKLAATGLVFFWNYFARRHFVFGAARP